MSIGRKGYCLIENKKCNIGGMFNKDYGTFGLVGVSRRNVRRGLRIVLALIVLSAIAALVFLR